MAKAPSDWLTLDRIKDELRIDRAIGDQDDILNAHLEDAVAFLTDDMDLPLLDRTGFLDAAPCIPILLADRRGEHPLGIPYLQRVDRVDVRTADDGPFDTALALGPNPMLQPVRMGRSPMYQYWPGAELPATAKELRVHYTQGMDAAGDPTVWQVRAALVLIIRDLWDGLSVAERTPAWERMIRTKVHGSVLT